MKMKILNSPLRCPLKNETKFIREKDKYANEPIERTHIVRMIR